MSRMLSCLIPPDPVLSDGQQFQNRFPCSLPDSNLSLCRDGGARDRPKEGESELGAGAMIKEVVAVGMVAVIVLGATYYWAVFRHIKGIDRYLNEAGGQFYLSAKDGRL